MKFLPRILVIDDCLGRDTGSVHNIARDNFCATFGVKDATDRRNSRQTIVAPIAEAVFCRGQIPVCAKVGDTSQKH